MTRHKDWQERLTQAIVARAKVPFQWGEHDCSTGAGALVEAMTGFNPWPGGYGLRDAARFSAEMEPVALGIAEQADWPLVALHEAQLGDLVLAYAGTKARPAMGIYLTHNLIFVSAVGWAFRPHGCAKRIWHV